MARPALISFLKVRVENLPPAGKGTGRVRVKIRAGTAAVDVPPKAQKPDGSVEWDVVREMTVPDANVRIVAIVSQELRPGDWSLVPDGRFDGPLVSALPNPWRQPSTPTKGPRFFAELNVFLEEVEQSGRAEAPGRVLRVDDSGEGSSVRGSFDASLGMLSSGFGASSSSSSGFVDAPSGDSLRQSSYGSVEGWTRGAALAVPVASLDTAATEAFPAQPSLRRQRASWTTTGARPNHRPAVRTLSGGFLLRQSSHQDRSNNRSFAGARRARATSFRGDDRSAPEPTPSSEPPDAPLRSPVGRPTVSRLLDPECPLDEDNGDESAGYFTPIGSPGVVGSSGPRHSIAEPEWGGPAFMETSPGDDEGGEEGKRAALAVAEGEGEEAAALADQLEGVQIERSPPPYRRSDALDAAAPAADAAERARPRPKKRWFSRNKPSTDDRGSASGPSSAGAAAVLRRTGGMAVLSAAAAAETVRDVPEGNRELTQVETGTKRGKLRLKKTVPKRGKREMVRTAAKGFVEGFDRTRHVARQGGVAPPSDTSDSLDVRQVAASPVAAAAPPADEAEAPPYHRDDLRAVAMSPRPMPRPGLAPSSLSPSVTAGHARGGVSLRTDRWRGPVGGAVMGAAASPVAFGAAPAALAHASDPVVPAFPTAELADVSPVSFTESSGSMEQEKGGFSLLSAEEQPYPPYQEGRALGGMPQLQPPRSPRMTISPTMILPPTGYSSMPKSTLNPPSVGKSPVPRESSTARDSFAPPVAAAASSAAAATKAGSSARRPRRKEEDRARVSKRQPMVPSSSSSIQAYVPSHGHQVRGVGATSVGAIVGVDNVCFSCFAPPAVSGGVSFLLRVSAYLRALRDEVLVEALSEGVVEAGLPGVMPIAREKRVTLELDLPEDTFKALPPDRDESTPGPGHPSVRDFVWRGTAAHADFMVVCQPGAKPGSVKCGARVIQGATVKRLSFHIKVLEAGSVPRCMMDNGARELDTTLEEVLSNVAVIAQEELTVLGPIGAGIQGETFRGLYQGKDVAIKRLAECPASSRPGPTCSGLQHEAAILSQLGHHPHIVEFYGLSRRGGGNGDEGVDVVTKLEEGGSLADVLGLTHDRRVLRNGGSSSSSSLGGGGGGRNGRGGVKGWEFDGGIRARWARDVARGLANAHDAGVLHNDVASRNALLSEKTRDGRALLCDFGLSQLLRGRGLEAGCLINLSDGATRWPIRQMPVEALDQPYVLSKLSDSWMFGMLMYEIFEGRTPFAGSNNDQVKRLVLEGKTLETPASLAAQGPNLVRVFKNCLQPDSSKRLSMEEVVSALS